MEVLPVGDIVIVILAFFGIILIPFGLGLLLNLVILAHIKNQTLEKVLRIVFCIAFLPAMLAFWSASSVTDSERAFFPFSLSLRARSIATLFSYAVYAYGYYWLFTHLF